MIWLGAQSNPVIEDFTLSSSSRSKCLMRRNERPSEGVESTEHGTIANSRSVSTSKSSRREVGDSEKPFSDRYTRYILANPPRLGVPISAQLEIWRYS